MSKPRLESIQSPTILFNWLRRCTNSYNTSWDFHDNDTPGAYSGTIAYVGHDDRGSSDPTIGADHNFFVREIAKATVVAPRMLVSSTRYFDV